MQTVDDRALLRQYAETRSDEAFTALAERHLGLVYAVARRAVEDSYQAEEVTQAVFLLLARNPPRLRHADALPSWLFQATRLTAGNFRRSETRRRRREQEAAMQSALNEPNNELWLKIAPLVDEAVAKLRAKDRQAILLRFYQGRSLREVSEIMGASEAAAEKRVHRALEKLRHFFARRDVNSVAAVLAGTMSSHAASAAPAGLAQTIAAVALGKSATATASTLTLMQMTMKTMTWMKLKSLLGLGTAVLVTGGATVAVLSEHANNPASTRGRETNAPAIVWREPLKEGMKIDFSMPPGGLALQKDGKIIVGSTLAGKFIDEQTGGLGFYTRAAFRLNPDGSLDRSFLCAMRRNDSSAFDAHAGITPEGKIMISGKFESLSSPPPPGYVRLLPDGQIDESFQPWRGRTNMLSPVHAGGMGVYLMTLLSDDSVAVMASGAIENMDVTTVYHLDETGQWIPPATNLLAAQFLRPSGMIQTLETVGFWGNTPIDWSLTAPPRPARNAPFTQVDNPPTRLNAAKVLQALFEEIPVELCRYAVRLPDGGYVLAIRDRADGSVAPGRIMRFDKNWMPDFSFTNQYEADLRSCLAIKRQPDGKLLVTGLMGKMNGKEVSGVVRLLENGQTDPTFHCETTNSWQGRVMDLAIQDDGRMVICGFFTRVNGVEVPHIARLNPDGSLDQSFQTVFMTPEQFDQERFGKSRRVPVASLNETNAAGLSPALSGTNTLSATVLINSIRMAENIKGQNAVITFTGDPNRYYVLQAGTNLDRGGWSNISTNRTSATGMGTFTDYEAEKFPMRFYRIATF